MSQMRSNEKVATKGEQGSKATHDSSDLSSGGSESPGLLQVAGLVGSQRQQVFSSSLISLGVDLTKLVRYQVLAVRPASQTAHVVSLEAVRAVQQRK